MKPNYTSIISFLLLIFTVYYSFTSLLPSKSSYTSEKTTTEFSVKRALVHLKEISKEPHYVGTKAHKEVQDYLVKQLENLGLEVNIQKQVALNKKWRAGVTAENIIAKIKGSDPKSKSLVLLTHYDSAVHSAIGASDAGSGVITILEGVRAYLATNPTPKNDIIILFTDAEEIGLLGANAFVNHHAWSQNVGLVLNFEARGTGGPSYMLLETNGGNKKLINAFSKAKPNFPVANSLMYSIYKALPNDTDLTTFREDGNINGFNFAFIDDHYDYHTAQDNYQNLDRNTLAQQGDYLMTLLPHFANEDLSNLDEKSDLIYFSFPKIGLVTYPFSWVLGMFILGALLFFAITFAGVQKNKLTTKAMFAGFVPFLSSLVIAGFITFFGWKLLNIIHPQYQEIIHGFTYNGHLYIAAFTLLTLGILFWFYKKYFKEHTAENLIVAPLFIWGIINLLIVIYLKGAGFFILPVYLALISLAVLLFSKKKKPLILVIITLLAVPTLLVFAPLVKMFPVGLGLKMLTVSTVFVVLLFGLLVPIFQYYKYTKKLSYLFFGVSFVFFIMASLKADYSTDRKQPTSLVYVIDANKGEAFYASYESKINDFNKAYLTGAEKDTTKNGTRSKYNSRYKIRKKANVFAIKHPLVNKLLDTIIANDRVIKLQIIPQRKTNKMDLKVKDSINFKEFKVNGESLRTSKDGAFIFNTSKRKTLLRYYFTAQDTLLNIEFTIPKSTKTILTLYDTKYDLFTNKFLNIKPRNTTKMMPTPFVTNDVTMVIKEIKL